MILDTDVLIWYLRGNVLAKKAVESSLPFVISVVTYMELVQGMRDKSEFQRLQKTLKQWRTDVVQIDAEISARAMFYVQEYSLSHAMQLADALIAATAVQTGQTLMTANDKHYQFIPTLQIHRFSPTMG